MEKIKAHKLEPGDLVTAPNVGIREPVEVDSIREDPDNTAVLHVHVKYPEGQLMTLHHRLVQPVPHTVDTYFRKRISKEYADIDAALYLPREQREASAYHRDPIVIDSVCGEECRQAIDAGAELIRHITAAVGTTMEAHEVERAVHLVCCVYING